MKLFKSTPKSEKSVSQMVEEIHGTFYTEVDRLLADAKIAKSLDTDKQELINKCMRLKALGFTNTKEVKEAHIEMARLDTLQRENKSKKTLMEAINYFSFKYPNYKFITEDSVKKICQEYGLVYGKICRYSGTVPDKNLKQMEQFAIKEDDEVYEYIETTWSAFGGSSMVRQQYMTKTEQEGYLAMDRDTISRRSYFTESCSKASLEIAAPLKDFNMEGMETKNFKISKIEIPDPVVLQPVLYQKQKYYLIVTAW